MDQAVRTIMEAWKAQFHQFGPVESQVEIASEFSGYEVEYAALRKGVGILQRSWKSLLRITGQDRVDFLQRMVSGDLKKLTPASMLRVMQLSDKGRVRADMVVLHGQNQTWLEMDRLDLSAVRTLYEARLFSEDMQMHDESDSSLSLALHGPGVQPLLEALGDEGDRTQLRLMMTQAGTHHELKLRGADDAKHAATLYRMDECGVPGVQMWMKTQAAAPVLKAMLTELGWPGGAWAESMELGERGKRKGRLIGWQAYNTARIEAGTPLFHVDFGPDSLPHETGVLSSRVSFTKGCYLGQEIVARMQNLGHPKQMLVSLKLEDSRLPIAGSQVMELPQVPTDDGKPPPDPQRHTGNVIGAVTSSTLSPLLGQTALALAMMKWGQHQPGTQVAVAAEGQMVRATVQGLGLAL